MSLEGIKRELERQIDAAKGCQQYAKAGRLADVYADLDRRHVAELYEVGRASTAMSETDFDFHFVNSLLAQHG